MRGDKRTTYTTHVGKCVEYPAMCGHRFRKYSLPLNVQRCSHGLYMCGEDDEERDGQTLRKRMNMLGLLFRVYVCVDFGMRNSLLALRWNPVSLLVINHLQPTTKLAYIQPCWTFTNREYMYIQAYIRRSRYNDQL